MFVSGQRQSGNSWSGGEKQLSREAKVLEVMPQGTDNELKRFIYFCSVAAQ